MSLGGLVTEQQKAVEVMLQLFQCWATEGHGTGPWRVNTFALGSLTAVYRVHRPYCHKGWGNGEGCSPGWVYVFSLLQKTTQTPGSHSQPTHSLHFCPLKLATYSQIVQPEKILNTLRTRSSVLTYSIFNLDSSVDGVLA